MTMTVPLSGGCACGAIRYECSARPIVSSNCHCRDCQRASGGPYTPVVYVPANAFKITKGTPKYYKTASEMAGDNVRGFCPQCGSRLFGGLSDIGQGIAASTLDDPSLFEPQFEIFVSDAQPWDRMDPQTRKFEKYQPQG